MMNYVAKKMLDCRVFTLTRIYDSDKNEDCSLSHRHVSE